MTDDELDGLAHLVKPLAWSDCPQFLEENAAASAESGFGRRYFVSDHSWWGPGVIVSTGYKSEADARRAAEKDRNWRILSALNLDALRSPPADVGEAIDADDIQQAMSDVFSEGGSVRDAAVYVKACIDHTLAGQKEAKDE